MDAALITAFVTAFAAILAAVIAAILPEWLKNRQYLRSIPSAPIIRKKSLYGEWRGTLRSDGWIHDIA